MILEEWIDVGHGMKRLEAWVEQTQKTLERPEEHVNVRDQLQKKGVSQFWDDFEWFLKPPENSQPAQLWKRFHF